MARGNLAEGGDPQLEDPNEVGIGGSEVRNPSVYLSVCRRDSSFAPKPYYRLYKVNVPSSGDSESSLVKASAATKRLPRNIKLKTDVGGKTFASMASGRFIGVGGDPGGTIIVDTAEPSKPKVIRGPNLLAAKWDPVVAAIGHKVYALSRSPSYIEEPDFVPWFEVLDLSKGMAADGSLCMDMCFWEELPSPPCFPLKLTPTSYIMPPIITVRSYAVVLPYILISLDQNTSCTYAFDTNSGQWHKIHGKYLPFVGPAIPHGQIGCVFLGSSENGSINAYRIRVSTSSSSSTVAGVSGKGSALKLSINEFFLRNRPGEEVGTMTDQYITSHDRKHFSVLTFSLDDRECSTTYYSDDSEEDAETYSRKLLAKLTTYKIENPAILERTQDQEKLQAPEITISAKQEQAFKFSSSYGFFSPPISFALSI